MKKKGNAAQKIRNGTLPELILMMGAQIAQPNRAPEIMVNHQTPLLKIVPEVNEAIKNTVIMSKRCLGFLLFMIDDYYSLRSYYFKFPPSNGIQVSAMKSRAFRSYKPNYSDEA